jgi:hypothetical protein
MVRGKRRENRPGDDQSRKKPARVETPAKNVYICTVYFTIVDSRFQILRTLDSPVNRFGQRDIGLHIDENLGLEAGTYHGKRRNTTRI